jgi:hypothetical protein
MVGHTSFFCPNRKRNHNQNRQGNRPGQYGKRNNQHYHNKRVQSPAQSRTRSQSPKTVSFKSNQETRARNHTPTKKKSIKQVASNDDYGEWEDEEDDQQPLPSSYSIPKPSKRAYSIRRCIKKNTRDSTSLGKIDTGSQENCSPFVHTL